MTDVSDLQWAEPVYEELLTPGDGKVRREPVPDADAPCPRCGERSWLVIEKRAEPEAARTRWRAIACASCGAADGWVEAGRPRPGRRDDEDDDWESPFGDARPTLAELVQRAGFAVISPSATPRVASYSYENTTICSVSLADAGVRVSTHLRLASSGRDPRAPLVRGELVAHAQRELFRELGDRNRFASQGRSLVAEDLAIQAWRRELLAVADGAPVVERMWSVDGTPMTFVVATADACWGAAADLAPREVTACGQGEPPNDLSLAALPSH